MRSVLGLSIAVIAAANFNHAHADDTASVMCKQFAISGAAETVQPTTQLSKDFVPEHHAPRNIPIDVDLPSEVTAYIHFPIVEDGTYLIYTTHPSRVAGIKEKNGNVISSSTVQAPSECPDELMGGLTADIEVGALTGPRPIAIEFTKGAAGKIQLIISRDPIN
ncbi:MAG: hypothetical protein AAF503_10225 [Pseudomonadota bacterium]